MLVKKEKVGLEKRKDLLKEKSKLKMKMLVILMVNLN